jgi:ElaB/YqjD/DUF883 family membrane-anchored ribosome-binding protein
MTHAEPFAPTGARASAADVKVAEATAVLDEAIESIAPKGREAAERTRDVLTAFDDIVREATRSRPYTTLAVAGLAGFLYAAVRRR